MEIHGNLEATIFLEIVRDVAGDEGVRKVLDARGGVQVDIPNKLKESHWLSITLGFAIATKVIEKSVYYDADDRKIRNPPFYLPLGIRSAARQLRDRAESLLLQGRPPYGVAIELGIHERTAWRHRARLVAAGKLPAGPIAKTEGAAA